MENNHLNFPQLRCQEHKSPIILVSPQFKDNEKNFFCSRCIALGGNKNDHQLMVIEDFVNYIATPAGINVSSTQEAVDLADNSKQSLNSFASHIESEKSHIANLSSELQNQYQEKCNEMVSELKEVLESQKGIFSNYFTRFGEEIAVDNEREANIPKFDEIRDTVSRLDDLVEIENYISRIVRQKEAWKVASTDLRTLGQRTQSFYQQQIQSISQNQPSFTSNDTIIDIWTTGLNQLIDRVKNQSGCFSNLYEVSKGIVLNIQTPAEVSLLTNQMIKADTRLVLSFPNNLLTVQQATQIGNELAALTNLRNLSLNLSDTQVSATGKSTSETIEEILKGVQQLTQLTSLSFNVYGSNLGDTFTVALGNSIGQLVNLQSLTIEVGMNNLTSAAVENLTSGWAGLTQLRTLSIEARYNRITDVSSLATALSALSTLLISLDISLGGYSASKNSLNNDTIRQVVRSIRHFTNLTNLSLDLGYTGIDEQTAIELAFTLKDLTQLRTINLQLYQNAIEARGAYKVAKRISKIPKLSSVILNLNFNDKVRVEGAREIVSTFRQSNQLSNLELSLVKVGVDKDQGTNLREDLTKNKLGQSFERVVVLF